MRCFLVPVALVLVIASHGGADGETSAALDTEEVLSPEQAAGKVVAALAVKDEAALKELALRADPDPWLVADELLFLNHPEAAEAFAGAAVRVDTERLGEYVRSRRGASEDGGARKARALAHEAGRAGRWDAMLVALDVAVLSGGDVQAADLGFGRAVALRNLGRLEESAAAFRAAAELARKLGWWAQEARALDESGFSAVTRGDFRGALDAWTARLAVEERRGDRAAVAATLGNLGNIRLHFGDYREALDLHERSLAIVQELGDREGVAESLGNIGAIHIRAGEFAKALDHLQRALALNEELDDEQAAAGNLQNLGIVHSCLGDFAKALEVHSRAREIIERVGDREALASSLANTGNVYHNLGDYARALECLERALGIQEDLADRSQVADTLANIANIHTELADFRSALELNGRALAIVEECGNRPAVGLILGNIGLIHQSLGDLAGALEFQERALAIKEEVGDRAGIAATLGNISGIYHALGDEATALEYRERSLSLAEELGDRQAVAASLVSIGAILMERGEHAKARELEERGLQLLEAVGDRAGVATALSNIGVRHERAGDLERALEFDGRALRLREELGDAVGVATSLGALGGLHRRLGRYDESIAFIQRAIAQAERLEVPEIVVANLASLAATHLARREPREALAASRRAVDVMSTLVKGLAEEQGAMARELRTPLFANGLKAACALGDAGESAFFIESGRAGALLEALAVREELRAWVLPRELLDAETGARARETAATHVLRRARASGDAAAVLSAEAELTAARGGMRAAVERIQREAKAAAGVAYPEADPLDRIQGRLREGETLVLYAMPEGDSIALAVTRREARIVRLGSTGAIEAACTALKAADAGIDVAPAVAELRKLVVEPLKLGAGTTRLLVSPDGVLSYVPFVLLAPDLEVAYVPSGTTYGLLLEDSAARGDGVLALGDPVYRGGSARIVVSLRGRPLARIPASGIEAKAVGDVVLLGEAASESGLRAALAGRPRWRAIHLACHGLVDPDHPMSSALAMTPDAEGDGLLTALEVFRMKCPADLVVLSACETGKGKVYMAEGIVGLSRAFMFAGAPRVMVSLWKVNDMATTALMGKFYEKWKQGLGAAQALREAQGYVQSHEEWRHPAYWAAWTLWGLPQ